MKVRATGSLNALSVREPAAARPVPRQKRGVGTSHCAGASISYALRQRESGSYRFDPQCFCLSPEAHGAQFLDGVPLPWVKGNA